MLIMNDYMIIGIGKEPYIHKYLKIANKANQYKNGKNDLFAVIIVLKYCKSIQYRIFFCFASYERGRI